MPVDLTGRAIVTGASRGIGLAIAQQLADAGANVVVTSRKQESADAAAAQIKVREGPGGRRPCGRRRCRQTLRRPAERFDHFGGIDILVNNAGTNPAYGPLIEQGQDRARSRNLEVDLWAPLLWTWPRG